MKKLLCLVLVLVTALSVLSGCGGNSRSNDEKSEISISVFDRGLISSEEGDYSNNRWTKWMEEQSGVKVNWVPIPMLETNSKLNMLFASGEAPDLIVSYDISQLMSFVRQGTLQPIDEFVDKYSTSYKNYLEENSELKNFLTYDDGKMYLATSKRSIDSIMNHGAWIRQDWLDELGLEIPKTIEDLKTVARAFKEAKLGGEETTPIALLNGHEIFPSLYQASCMWYNEDGQAKYGPTLDRFGSSIQIMKDLYDENLMDREFVTDTDGSRQKQLWATGKAGIFFNQWSESSNKELMQNNPNAKPVTLPPLETEYGINAYLQESLPHRYIAFNKNLKNPEAAMKFIDWMLDDGYYNIKFGNEGEHYKLVDGVPQTIDAEKYDKEVSYALDYAIVSKWELKPEWIPIMAAQDEQSQILAKQRMDALSTNMKYTYRRDYPYVPQTDEMTRLMSSFGTKLDEIKTKAIIGGPSKSVDWAMSEIRKEWKNLGGEEVEKSMTEWGNKIDKGE